MRPSEGHISAPDMARADSRRSCYCLGVTRSPCASQTSHCICQSHRKAKVCVCVRAASILKEMKSGKSAEAVERGAGAARRVAMEGPRHVFCDVGEVFVCVCVCAGGMARQTRPHEAMRRSEGRAGGMEGGRSSRVVVACCSSTQRTRARHAEAGGIARRSRPALEG